jgi:hypothetical protein
MARQSELTPYSPLRTHLARYSNLFVSAMAHMQRPGYTANFSSHELLGSAAKYLPDAPSEQTDLFYAMKLARDCSKDPGPFCREVPETMIK